MAGKVAKLVFPHNVGPNGDGFHTGRTAKVMRNMEEDDILNQLSDSNFSRRAEILDQLRSAARKNGGRLPFQDQKAIFRGFAMALADNDWDVRHHCIQLVHELIPHIGEELDECMGLILPRLVPNMGDTKITIRRAVIQTLHVYMKNTYDMQQTFKAIVQYGLENPQSRVRKEVIIALPMMFTPEFSDEDFFDIAQSLAKKLLDTSDDSIQQHALLSLEKIRNLVGDNNFSAYTQRLSPPLRKYYNKLTGRTDADVPYSSSSNSTRNDVSSFTPGDSVAFTTAVDNYTGNEGATPQGTRIHIPSSGGKFEYGVIPSHIMERLKESNFRARAQAVEELKVVLKDMNDVNVQRMSPHVLSFITYLTSLLDDSNFKITTVTLEILGLLVKRQGPSITAHLKALVGALSKRMGDNKIVIRQAIMKVIMQLMQVLSPKHVLSVICENLSNRNSRVRQETLNIVIASLLTFPSYDFDLAELCDIVAPTLIDPKRQVRQAALECYAAIGSNLGPGKLQPLVSSVDAVELSNDGDGVMAAVQARLARRILPKLNADGLVDYATPVPSSAGSRSGSVNLPPGPDIEWILSASGGTGGSARSNRSDIEIESVTSSARTTPAPPPLGESPSHGPTPRRSSGKGKGRLPWEETEVTSFENGYNNQSNNKLPRQKQLANTSSNSRDQSPDAGSYRQMYLQQKYKKQTSEQPAAQPFSVYGSSRDDENHSAFSTPRNNDDSARIPFSSNSWPDDPGKSNKRLLEPITDNENDQESDHSPIPMKPALARGTSSRSSSKRKVPPIPVTDRKMTDRQDSTDSARDSVLDFSDDTNRDEMQHSLRQIRNSATRKKVDKIFEVLDTQHKKMQVSRSPSPPDTFAESGIYSNASTMRSNLDEPDNVNHPTPTKKGSKKSKKGSKPKLPFPLKATLHHVKSHNHTERKDPTCKKESQNLGQRETVSESGLAQQEKENGENPMLREANCNDDEIGGQRLRKEDLTTDCNIIKEEVESGAITPVNRPVLPELGRVSAVKSPLPKVSSVPEAYNDVNYDKWRNKSFQNDTPIKSMPKNPRQRSDFHGKKLLPSIPNTQSLDRELSEQKRSKKGPAPQPPSRKIKSRCGKVKSDAVVGEKDDTVASCLNVAHFNEKPASPKERANLDGNNTVRSCTELLRNRIPKKAEALASAKKNPGKTTKKNNSGSFKKEHSSVTGSHAVLPRSGMKGHVKRPAGRTSYKEMPKKEIAPKILKPNFDTDKGWMYGVPLVYCCCKEKVPIHFRMSDSYNPLWRRQRLQKYLNTSPKLPRYTALFKEYKADNINICIWHSEIKKTVRDILPESELKCYGRKPANRPSKKNALKIQPSRSQHSNEANRRGTVSCCCKESMPIVFRMSDSYNPEWRRQRMEEYLNTSPKLPRYTALYKEYKADNMNICIWHSETQKFNVCDIPEVEVVPKRIIPINAKKATVKPGNSADHATVKPNQDEKPEKNMGRKKTLPPLKTSQPASKKEVKNKKSGKGILKTLKDKFLEREFFWSRKSCDMDDGPTFMPHPPSSPKYPRKPSRVSFRPEDRNTCDSFVRANEDEEVYQDEVGAEVREMDETEDEYLSMKKGENPFESKPRLARKPSQSKADREPGKPPVKESKSNNSLVSTSVAQIDFSPHGGVTFKENPGVNLQMVGMGIDHDQNQQTKPPKQASYGAKARERRRVSKDLARASTSSSSSSSLQSAKSSQSDGAISTRSTTSITSNTSSSNTAGHVLVGHGVFEGPGAASEQAVGTPPDRREKRAMPHVKPPLHEPDSQRGGGLGGVYGVGVRQNSIDKEDGDEEEDDVNSFAISQATRANMQLKVQQKKEEAERQREEKERQRAEKERQRAREVAEEKRKRQEADAQRRKQEAETQRQEKERQQLRLRRLSDQPDADVSGLAVSGSGSQQTLNGQGSANYSTPAPKPPPTKPAHTTPVTKRKVKPVAEEKSPSLGSAKSSSEPESPDQLKPFKDAQRALDEALKGLGQEEWDIKCSSINSIRRLAAHHPDVLCTSQLHTLNLALISEVKNLRSQVSRLAIMCLGEMFHKLRKHMEADLDQVAGVLLAKAGESSNFIRDDMDQALRYMVEGITAQRAMLALIVGGASHRNPAVRKTTSYFLVSVVEKMGPGRILSGIKDVTDRILPVAANFLMDGNPETRYNGSKMFHMLMSHEDFDRVLNKHLPQSTVRNISDKLETLKRKGLSDPPTENGSAKNRRSGHGSRINSSVRYNSASTSGTDSTPTSSKQRSAMPRTDEATMEEIKTFTQMMTASDWRERQNGITRMHEVITRNPTVVGTNVVKIFDKFVPCLKDSNSKVNLFALQTMDEVTRPLAEYFGSVINYTIQTVASNLSSKNKDIYDSACTVLDSFMNTLDETILLQPFCNQAQNGNSRIKPDMVDRVAYLVNCVYPVRPRQVVLHVLPLLWHLLGSVSQSGATPGGTGNLRLSTNHLVHALFSQMGDSLLEHTKGNSSVTPRTLQCLQDMMDNPALDD